MTRRKPNNVTLPDTSVSALARELQRNAAGSEGIISQNDWQESSRQSRSGQALLKKILALSLILADDWIALPVTTREAFQRCTDSARLLDGLVAEGLLTTYQASRLKTGKMWGLVLGNYRVLDRVGTGAMSTVYKGQHIRMLHTVAIKVLSLGADQNPLLLTRFYAEMRAVARLHHPNIVAAIDAGECHSESDEPTLHYFVMEYVQGQNLEEYVKANGPLSSARACQIVYQVAAALGEAHKHNLVHRDIKPSNILLTTEDQAKLLDFGLAMHFRSRMTEPGTLLGTIDFMAPEQACDPSSVDERADIYSLGATFFWCLTGQTPFSPQESLRQELVVRMTQVAPSVRTLRPNLEPELDAVVARMMALQPADRYPTPQAVNRALLRFIERDSLLHHAQLSLQQIVPAQTGAPAGKVIDPSPIHRILVVDDEIEIRTICQSFLQGDGMECDVSANGTAALQTLASQPYDLVLLDVNMPGMTGVELVRRLRACPPCANLKLIMFSGRIEPDEMAQLLKVGVDDFLSKPFTGVQLVARIEACLRHKKAEDRSDRLANLLLTVNAEMEKNLMTRDSDLVQTRNVLVLAMARIAEQRHTQTCGHLIRMQRFCRCLAEEAAQLPIFVPTIDKNFIELLACAVPLHDIGMVAVPNHIVLKPEKLTGEERILMQQHTTIGSKALQELGRQQCSLMAFMQMASDISRYHHERFDGCGYPDRLKGNAIPLSARLTALADVYDALRSGRAYRPAMSHSSALQIMGEASEGHFDPSLVPVLDRCGPRFEAIFRDSKD
jgi:response regulator RpfG family c-di-GMP phosphodiesterase/serine/threonine protein kinase